MEREIETYRNPALMKDAIKSRMLNTVGVAYHGARNRHGELEAAIRSFFPNQPDEAFAQLSTDLAKYRWFRSEPIRDSRRLLSLPGRLTFFVSLTMEPEEIQVYDFHPVLNGRLHERQQLGPVAVAVSKLLVNGGLSFENLEAVLVQYAVLTAFEGNSKTLNQIRVHHIADEGIVYSEAARHKFAAYRMKEKRNEVLETLAETGRLSG